MVKNKGYTLVEALIVITIMVILSGASFISIGIIRESKRQAATNTLNNQISNCLIQTKAVSKATNGTDAPLCMVIRKRTDGAYAVMTGYIYGSGTDDIKDASGNALNPDNDDDCEAILTKDIVKIEYTPDDTAQQFAANDLVIQFIKSDGSTQYGGGTYELYAGKTGSEKLYATIYLDKVSGNHYIK